MERRYDDNDDDDDDDVEPVWPTALCMWNVEYSEGCM